MQLQPSFLALAACLGAALTSARFIPSGADVAAAVQQSRSAAYEEIQPFLNSVKRDGGQVSVIHDRVTRHIRPDESDTFLRKRQAPATDVGGQTDFKGQDPQPIRGSKGASFLHESNVAKDKQNVDYVSAPPTDSGVIPNLKWSFSDSKTRLLNGGWTREQVVTDLPTSKSIAAAEQRLAPYASRELHWHRVAEWGFVLNGTVRITANDADGHNTVSDVPAGDLWSFPRSVPHSVQAGPDGAQYLLVFDDGNFDASGTTFMLDDWVTHTPREIIASSLGWDPSVFNTVPTTDPYIINGTKWLSLEEARQVIGANPEGELQNPYHYELTKQEKKIAPGGGGWVKVTDHTKFPQSATLASGLIHVDVGAARSLHWHSNSEWGYIVSGKGRATAFAGGATARTFDLQAGDTWVFPESYGHYVANTGDEPLIFLEIFAGHNFGDTATFDDFSLNQWLSLTPPELAAQQLNVSVDLIKALPKENPILVKGAGKKNPNNY